MSRLTDHLEGALAKAGKPLAGQGCPVHGHDPDCACYMTAGYGREATPITAELVKPDVRFRVEFSNVGDEASGDCWQAIVWDLADHGSESPYARVQARRLSGVIRHVDAYLLAAEVPLDSEVITLHSVEERGGSVSPL